MCDETSHSFVAKKKTHPVYTPHVENNAPNSFRDFLVIKPDETQNDDQIGIAFKYCSPWFNRPIRTSRHKNPRFMGKNGILDDPFGLPGDFMSPSSLSMYPHWKATLKATYARHKEQTRLKITLWEPKRCPFLHQFSRIAVSATYDSIQDELT